ncbi:MAG TPA: SCO family protein [Anaerolineales bacterium]|nr:SCO family protein [Anaerolineales bacterium]
MIHKTVWVGMVSVAAVAVAAAVWLLNAKPALHGAVIEPPAQAAEIRLKDFDGQEFTLSSLRGKVVVIYFGYTNCPDECPLTMAHLKLATDQLGAGAKDVRVVMISTDPTRDSAQAMKQFLGSFSPDFIGLVGSPEDLAQVWKDYGVTVEDGGETHSYFVYVIDPSGRFRETFLPDSEPADMAADIRQFAQGR